MTNDLKQTLLNKPKPFSQA